MTYNIMRQIYKTMFTVSFAVVWLQIGHRHPALLEWACGGSHETPLVA